MPSRLSKAKAAQWLKEQALKHKMGDLARAPRPGIKGTKAAKERARKAGQARWAKKPTLGCTLEDMML